MATYYWRGQGLLGYEGRNVSITLLKTKTVEERKYCHWNNPSNWFVATDGPIPSENIEGLNVNRETEPFSLIEATFAPGGNDTVIFQNYTYDEIEYPLSPCLYGGYWGTDGWLNASSTGGQLKEFNIKSSYGDPDLRGEYIPDFYEFVGTAWYRIGTHYKERPSMLYEDFGYDFAGTDHMTGLRIFTKKLKNEAGEAFVANYVMSDIIVYDSTASYCSEKMIGGTAGSVILDCTINNVNSLLGFSTKKDGPDYHDDISPSPIPAITQSVNIKKVRSRPFGEIPFGPRWGTSIESRTSIPNVKVASPYRAGPAILGDVDELTILPERRRGFMGTEGDGRYNAVTIGTTALLNDDLSPRSYRIAKLNMFDGNNEFSVYTHDEQLNYETMPLETVVGANNLLSINGKVTIDELNVEAGRIILGGVIDYGSVSYPPYGGPQGYRFSPQTNDHPVLITDGDVGENVFIDLVHPSDDTYMAVKLGTGDNHPGGETAAGLLMKSEKSKIKFPKSIRVVADYKSDQVIGVHSINNDVRSRD